MFYDLEISAHPQYVQDKLINTWPAREVHMSNLNLLNLILHIYRFLCNIGNVKITKLRQKSNFLHTFIGKCAKSYNFAPHFRQDEIKRSLRIMQYIII